MTERFALAYPAHEADRAIFQALVPEAPLPAIVPGSTVEPCDDCGLALSVGPYVRGLRDGYAAQGEPITLLCPLCALDRTATASRFKILSLGNPDSRPE